MWPETFIPKRTVDLRLFRGWNNENNTFPNGGGLMVMNPMVETVKDQL